MVMAGCSSLPPGAEPGPHHTMAYDVLVESTPPGARIQAEGRDIGAAPCHLKIFGDPDGTFHDFGSYTYTVRAYPVATNQFPQVIVFGTGKMFTHEDMIPGRILFNMNLAPAPNYGGYPGYGYPGYQQVYPGYPSQPYPGNPNDANGPPPNYYPPPTNYPPPPNQ